MTKTLKIFDTGGKSKESLIGNNLDSIRSTLFGKFYEGIVAKWLEENEKYKHLQGKPCVYWDDIIISKKDKNVISVNLIMALKNIKKDGGKHTNSDGLFIKKKNYYLWEAKNWPKWNGGQKNPEDQIRKKLMESPWLLAKKVRFKKKEEKLTGILFSWWDKFSNYKKLENEITKAIGIPFKFYFTSVILEDCRSKQYSWYIDLINEQKNNIDLLFVDLLSKP